MSESTEPKPCGWCGGSGHDPDKDGFMYREHAPDCDGCCWACDGTGARREAKPERRPESDG